VHVVDVFFLSFSPRFFVFLFCNCRLLESVTTPGPGTLLKSHELAWGALWPLQLQVESDADEGGGRGGAGGGGGGGGGVVGDGGGGGGGGVGVGGVVGGAMWRGARSSTLAPFYYLLSALELDVHGEDEHPSDGGCYVGTALRLAVEMPAHPKSLDALQECVTLPELSSSAVL